MARLRAGGFTTALVLLLAVIVVLFHGVFLPEQTLFSNDGPLSQLMAQCHRLPDRFFGCWLDLNSVGFNGGAASPSITFGLLSLLGPVLFSKLYAVLSLLILGLSAWCFFRQSKLSPLACILGGLAAVLNSTFFSVACWGVGAHDITIGMVFLALAALADASSPQRWLRVILAGMALGMAVTEGADVGAIFSLYVAAFVIYQTWTVEGPLVKNVVAGGGRLMLVAVCAAFLAAQSIHGLIGTEITGVKGTQQDAQTKLQRWDWATQWSLPKTEALNLIVPGLFGYRMDMGNGQNYWGIMGRDPAWERYIDNGRQGPQPTGLRRYSGGGNYAGVLVVLAAIWAGAQSLRRKNSVFNLPQRKWLWFWLAVAVVSLLLAFGRFAPFYKFVYALPYFSTIRNPVKFLDLFSFAVIVLFAYGLDGLCRQYMKPAVAGRASSWAGLQSWWSQASKFEKNWVYGCGIAWLLSLLAWWQYAAHHDDLVQYLQTNQVGGSQDAIANFSFHQAGWFVVVFLLAAVLMVLIFSGAFAGRRAFQGGVCLALLLVGDLGPSNYPWIVYWNYNDKYASNPVVDVLQDKPFEYRVAATPLDPASKLSAFTRVYKIDWLQQLFPYYNIQSFETVEMSRMPEDYAAWVAAINDTNTVGIWFHLARAWQFTSSGYIIGPGSFPQFLGGQGYFAQSSLQPIASFRLGGKPGVTMPTRPDQLTAYSTADGPYALFRFTAALPRAKLFSRWQVSTNDAAVLKEMFNPAFDPAQSVFVAGGVPASSANDTNQSPGSVEIVSYDPKDIALKADASAPSILLLNDHFDPGWKVFVDGRPQELLRCNFLMRGVHLDPGTHQVEFKFRPPTGMLYVSLAAVATTALICVILAVSSLKNRAAVPTPAVPAPAPEPQPKAGRNSDSRKKSAKNQVAKK